LGRDYVVGKRGVENVDFRRRTSRHCTLMHRLYADDPMYRSRARFYPTLGSIGARLAIAIEWMPTARRRDVVPAQVTTAST